MAQVRWKNASASKNPQHPRWGNFPFLTIPVSFPISSDNRAIQNLLVTSPHVWENTNTVPQRSLCHQNKKAGPSGGQETQKMLLFSLKKSPETLKKFYGCWWCWSGGKHGWKMMSSAPNTARSWWNVPSPAPWSKTRLFLLLEIPRIPEWSGWEGTLEQRRKDSNCKVKNPGHDPSLTSSHINDGPAAHLSPSKL